MDLSAINEIIKKRVSEAFEFNDNKSFAPTFDIANTAKEALQAVSKNDLTPNAGNDGSGKRKAQQLSNRTSQSHDQLKRLKAFFEKYSTAVEKEKQAGKNLENSGLIQMWKLHGGDAANSWVKNQIESLKKSNNNTKQRLQKAGGAGENKGMGIFGNANNTETRTHSAWSKVKNREQNS